MLVGIFGLSGCGKTTIVRKMIDLCPLWNHTSASLLIKEYNGEIAFDKINKNNIISNQDILINAVKVIDSKPVFLLELHNVIELPNSLEIIDKNVIDSLNLDVSIFIYSSPLQIVNNRFSDLKKRKISDVNEIKSIQKKSIELFLENSNSKSIIINSNMSTPYIIGLIDNFKNSISI